MKTTEFIEIMENKGYTVTHTNGNIYVGYDGHTIVEVLEYTFGAIDTSWSGFEKLEQHEVEDIIETAYKYILTPLEEREEPKKYYLRLPGRYNLSNNYLNYDINCDEYVFYDKDEITSHYRTQFTQEEIDNFPHQEFVKILIKEEVE